MGLFDVFKKKEDDKVVVSPVPEFLIHSQELPAVESEVSEKPKTSSSDSSKGFILHRCFKCRQKTPMNVETAKVHNLKSGSKGQLLGHCSICGSYMSRFCKVVEAEEVMRRG